MSIPTEYTVRFIKETVSAVEKMVGRYTIVLNERHPDFNPHDDTFQLKPIMSDNENRYVDMMIQLQDLKSYCDWAVEKIIGARSYDVPSDVFYGYMGHINQKIMSIVRTCEGY